MRVEAPDLAKAADAAVFSLYRPHSRNGSAPIGVAGAGTDTNSDRQPLGPGRFRNAFASGITNWFEMATSRRKDQ